MKPALITIALLTLSVPSMAQSYTSQRIGNQVYTNGPDGYNATSNTVGNQTYTNDNQGHNCTTNQVGNQVYTHCY